MWQLLSWVVKGLRVTDDGAVALGDRLLCDSLTQHSFLMYI